MRKIIYKLLVLIASLAVVAGIVGGVYYVQDKKAKEEAAGIEAEENAAKEVAKAAMTEEEIQALYKEHKKETPIEPASEETSEEATEEATQEAGQRQRRRFHPRHRLIGKAFGRLIRMSTHGLRCRERLLIIRYYSMQRTIHII